MKTRGHFGTLMGGRERIQAVVGSRLAETDAIEGDLRQARAKERWRSRRGWRCSRALDASYFEARHVLHLSGHLHTHPDEVWRRYGVLCPPLPCEREGRHSIISCTSPSPASPAAACMCPAEWIYFGLKNRSFHTLTLRLYLDSIRIMYI